MSLATILEVSSDKNKFTKKVLSEERILENIDEIRSLIAYYREYPDRFIDDMKGPECPFDFQFVQRLFLRAVMRHKYVYCTFPRGFSKSFLSMMALMLKAILFPRSHLSITTGGKEQAASITAQKVDEICQLIPSLANEIDWSRGVSKRSKNDVVYKFKNGSIIDILPAKESSRGQRRTSILIEEAILVDGEALNTIVIPTTNIDRHLADGTTDPDEVINQSLTYITTAGWKGTFAYEKMVETFVNSIMEPDKYMVLGGDYVLSILEGRAKKTWLEDLKLSGSYNAASFDREYRSVWGGDSENAFFSSDIFDKYRKLLQPEYEYSGRSSKSSYYVLGVDVGRYDCQTEVMVFKVTPQIQGTAIKTLVNIYSYEAEDFEEQAIHLKKIYYKYKARIIALDANGVGAGFVDFLTKSQIDPETGVELPPFGVDGGTSDKAVEPYKKVSGPTVENNALFLIKATAPINTEGYGYIQTQLSSGKIHLLIDERDASMKLMETKLGQNMTPDERNTKLMPFQLTTNLKEQMMNLRDNGENGVNINLKQINNGIPKDKVSAFMYGLYYIKKQEEKKTKKKRRISDFMLFS